MKTVSSAFALEQSKASAKPVRAVYYKRRYWQESTKSYIWESSWTAIPESEVVQISSVNWALDTQAPNEFKLSNLTLVLKNERNQWKKDNRAGKFYRDAASIFDYEPYWTKFQLRAGYNLPDGTQELITLFTGVALEYNYNSKSAAVQISVSGLEAILQNADAERVCYTVTNESLTGTVNGTNKVFTTTNTGVAGFTFVSDNSVEKKAGSQYDVSNLNVKGTVATVTFVTAPTTGTPKADYTYWKTNKKFEELIADLCAEASITSTDIQSVVFGSALANSWTQTLKADWDAGALTRVNTALFDGSFIIEADSTSHTELLDDFNSGIGSWNQGSKNTWSGAGNKLQFNSISSPGVNFGPLSIYRGQTRAYGRWSMILTNNRTANGYEVDYHFIAGSVDLSTGSATRAFGAGYVLIIGTGDTGTNRSTISLYRVNSSGGLASQIGADYVFTGDTSAHTIKIVRYTNGHFVVSLDSTQIITGTDNTVQSSVYCGFFGQSAWGAISNMGTIDDVYQPTSTMSGSLTTQYLDAGPSVTNWGILTSDFVENGGTITPYTRTSPDHSTWDAYLALGTGNAILSDLDRYFEAKYDLSCSTTSNQHPIVNSLVLNYTTVSTFISMANFSGMTVYDAIQELARIPNYEWGFKPDETFFFRARPSSTDPDYLLAHKTNVSEIISVESGFARVYGVVKTTHGNFSTTLTDDGNAPSSPLKRFSRLTLQLDSSKLLVKEDVDVATYSAQQLYTAYSKPKRILRLKAKFIPQLDLSDIAKLNYYDIPSKKEWAVGDPNVTMGDNNVNLWGGSEQLAINFLAKVVGVRYDTVNWTCEIDLEEILV